MANRHIMQPLSQVSTFADSGAAVLVEDQVWTRARIGKAFLDLCAHWASDPAVSSASLVAVHATSTLQTLLQLLALIELGIPFVPLHSAWSNTQCRDVIELTGAHQLAAGAPPPASHQQGEEGRRHLQRSTTDESPLAVVFTSGSTGTPKGAILSRRAFAVSAEVAQLCLGLEPDEVYYLSLPLAHVGGLAILTRAAVLGGTLVLPAKADSLRAGFDAEQFVRRCAETDCTVVSLVPTQLRRICQAGLHAPNRVKLVLVGGAPLTPDLIRSGLELGWPIHRTYGLTEACSQVATDRTPGLFGPIELLPHVEARIQSGGCLALRGEALFTGYWGQPTRSVGDWFVTSDLTTLDPTGITPLGRADELIISGGENIHPVEVDAALASAAGVIAACAFARDSAEWGHELCAALVVDATFDATRLMTHLRAQLASFKIPKAWIIVAELPATATGKLSRRRCQQLYAAACSPLL